MTDKQLALSVKARPKLRTSLIWMLTILLLLGSVAAVYADPLWLKLTQYRCNEHFLKDENRQAIAKLRIAATVSPTNTETLFLLIRGHRREGDLSRALVLLTQVEALGGDAERIELERKLLLIQSGRIRESEASLSSMLMKGGDFGSDVLQAFVLGYFANLRTDEASQLLDMWQQSTPNDPQAYFLKAYLLRSLRQLPAAIAQYQKGLKIAPRNRRMQLRLAECYIENSQIKEARAELLESQETSTDLSAELLLAKCDYADQQLASAQKRLSSYLDSNPDSIEAKTLRGRIRLESGEANGAIEDLQSIVDREPTQVLAREALGRALMRVDRKQDAEKHFDFVKQATQAQSDISRLIRQSLAEPNNVAIRFQIGQLASEYVSRDDGAKWMRTVLEIEPTHPGANAVLADYHQNRGDMSTAMMYRSVANQSIANRNSIPPAP